MVFAHEVETSRSSTSGAMAPFSSQEVQLDVSRLPGCVQSGSDTSIHQISSEASIETLTDEAFVVECENDAIIPESQTPSCDDGISMNYSIASVDDCQGVPVIFVTSTSGVLPPIYDCQHAKKEAQSPNFPGPVLSCKEDPEKLPPLGHSHLGAGDSRVSLIPIEKKTKNEETWWNILSQIGLPFLIAGLGMVGAGLLLDYVMNWPVFVEIGELVILVTPLLGLKGNLEMTLAARLSTHANIGNLNKCTGNKWPICKGNLILDQLQAIVCGFVASLIAVTIGYLFTGKFNSAHMSLVVVSSVLTASMVSLILGSTMISVILLSKKYKINPDNVATPVAGSLGDVVTLGMLSFFASLIYNWYNKGFVWVPFVIIGFYILCLPVCFFLAFRNDFTRQVTITGWLPLLVSVGISTGGGILLDMATGRFPGVALYQPVINGIGGNLVSVQASRISSYLHGHCSKKVLPDKGGVCESPIAVFFGKGINSMSARLLLMLAIPGHLVFATVTHFVAAGDDTNYGPIFLAIYVTAAVIQVTILLYIAKILTNLCWIRGTDPDTATIPYLTALGDFLGSGLLFIAFELLALLKQVTRV